MIHMTSIGSKLRYLRSINDYSSVEVAEYLDISQDSLFEFENDLKKLHLTVFNKICFLYDCTPEYLLGQSSYYQKPDFPKNMDLNVISKIHKLKYHLSIIGKDRHIKAPVLCGDLKDKWNISKTSPVNILDVLLKNISNLTVIGFPMTVPGYFYKSDYDRIILLNSDDSILRQRFTLACQLSNLVEDAGNH